MLTECGRSVDQSVSPIFLLTSHLRIRLRTGASLVLPVPPPGHRTQAGQGGSLLRPQSPRHPDKQVPNDPRFLPGINQ